MLRFTLQRASQHAALFPCAHAMSWRGWLPGRKVKSHARGGSYLPEVFVQRPTGARKGFLPARRDRSLTRAACR